MQAQGCYSSLWLRGLPAKRAFYVVDSSTEIKGVWPVPDLTGVRFATDATGPKDPRDGPVLWGVIAFRVLEGDEEGDLHTGQIQVVGSITGAVSHEQTVFRGEAAAVCETVRAHPGEDELDITLDCEGVLRRIHRRNPGHSNRDLLDPVRAGAHRLRLTWINSHLDRKAFGAKFGHNEEWRRQANSMVDELVKNRARRIAGPTVQATVRLWDRQVQEVLQFLGQRVSYLLTADEADKAAVLFRPRAARPSRGAPQSKPTEVVEARPSRRQQLESLIQDGTRGGHCWQESHRGSTNLTISCSRCGLYVQQNDNACIFDRKTKQPCAGQAMDLLPGMHPSHKLESLGSAFICIQCKRVQRVGFSTLAPVFGKLCAPTQTCNSKLSKMWRQSRETQQHAPPAGAGGGQGGQEMRGTQKQTFKKNSVRNDDSGLVQPRLTFRPKPRAQDR